MGQSTKDLRDSNGDFIAGLPRLLPKNRKTHRIVEKLIRKFARSYSVMVDLQKSVNSC